MGNGIGSLVGSSTNGPVSGRGIQGGGGDGSFSASVRLTYFDFNFRAELIRLVLAAGEVPFEDKRIDYPEWAELKPKTPLGTLPILEYGEDMFGQSTAIARFAAKLGDLYGSSIVNQARADMVVDLYWEILGKIEKIIRTKEEDEKAKLLSKLFEEELPNYFTTCQALVAEMRGDFINGEEMSYADIAITDLITRMGDPHDKTFSNFGMDQETREMPEKHPLLTELARRVSENEGIQVYWKNLKAGSQAQEHAEEN